LNGPTLWLAAAAAAALLFVPRLLTRFGAAYRLTGALRRARRSREPDMRRAAAYHERLAIDASRLTDGARDDALDDRTWADLDLDDVFVALDRTISEPGRQYLYRLLRTPRMDAAPLARLERASQRFASDDEPVQRARAALDLLGDRRAGYLVELLYGDLPERPRVWWIVPLLTVAAVACLTLVKLWSPILIVWIAVCVVNVVVQLAYKPRVKELIPAMHEIPALLRVADTLAALPLDELAAERDVLRDGAQRLGRLRRAASWLVFEPGQGNELVSSVYEYINLFFLLDVNAFLFGTEAMRESRDVMRAMFEAVGAIDAAQSIAAWRDTLPRWTTPTFTAPRKALQVEGLVHPLVAEAVPNALDVDGTSVLITGSNMSGKTTFVRAMGVNAVLAQTLHTVCAESWRAPMLRVRTSIGRSDSVMDGRSYYLAEVESVRTLVRASDGPQQHLFLLDEIYRGTNTTERIAAAYAVLAHLDRGTDIVLVATHDLELLGMLDGTYAAHHFREQIAGDALTFDFRIRPGPSSTRNAIALLRLMQYPEEIIVRALGAIPQPFR
jgi:hypothetical protein